MVGCATRKMIHEIWALIPSWKSPSTQSVRLDRRGLYFIVFIILLGFLTHVSCSTRNLLVCQLLCIYIYFFSFLLKKMRQFFRLYSLSETFFSLRNVIESYLVLELIIGVKSERISGNKLAVRNVCITNTMAIDVQCYWCFFNHFSNRRLNFQIWQMNLNIILK